ncbi:hypothetical protein [uncultured Gammaproteobacteria bacterium]|nr:hypothetical protein [uncultured Gammaproteobacteria bacterium]CAC9559741.1 hypothetical protein [uncultured Gammaproteobacteria bacterium]CAC9567863.1 hypothetical protein [uncultured Gammaproteobacteria bacterium]CAC9570383.1 hypothetical protein [uncultured Gammaproteobacteria bacterium]CAC9574160.1 hypothetical protein [uncultured Gammaproteobacteria bacterium]
MNISIASKQWKKKKYNQFFGLLIVIYSVVNNMLNTQC